MENSKYEFFTTVYDKEELRVLVLLLSEGHVRFKINNKSSFGSSKAPLSSYIEADILIDENDYAGAVELIKKNQ